MPRRGTAAPGAPPGPSRISAHGCRPMTRTLIQGSHRGEYNTAIPPEGYVKPRPPMGEAPCSVAGKALMTVQTDRPGNHPQNWVLRLGHCLRQARAVARSRARSDVPAGIRTADRIRRGPALRRGSAAWPCGVALRRDGTAPVRAPRRHRVSGVPEPVSMMSKVTGGGIRSLIYLGQELEKNGANRLWGGAPA